MTDEERKKFILISKIESTIKGLELQKKRMLEQSISPMVVSPVHDVDFYMVILRRLFRVIESHAKIDSSVANLKGKFNHLYKKIKIRDDFEHDVDYEKVPEISPGLTIVCTFISNKTNPHIISGDQQWHLINDHESMLNLMSQFLTILKK